MILNEEKARETIEWLEKHSNNPTYCIHFNDLNKVGLNPNFRWNTPLGVASYPLKESWEVYGDIRNYPWGNRRRYIIVLDYAPGARVLEVEKITNADVRKLANLFLKNNILSEYEIEEAIEEARLPRPYWEYWNIMRYAAIELAKMKNSRMSITWNVILRKILNYDIVSDRKGLGILHPNEPYQVLFLHPNSWVHVKTLLNPYSRKKDY